MRKFLLAPVAAVLCVLLLAGCAQGQQKYTATYFDVFDTVTTVVGMADSQAEFNEQARQVYTALKEYHQLFDIYNEYPGINNLKTVNDAAGVAPVKVDERIILLLKDCKGYYELTDGRVNVAMGSVLHLWHEKRSAALEQPESAALPEIAALEEAAKHTDIENIIIDEQAGTVFLADPHMRLDVGAIAKGWAAQAVAEQATEGLLISVGGNVCATGPKDEVGTPWVVGIQNPEGGDYLHTLALCRGSMVTSGDYQRTYSVDGVDYHHIIDPDTSYPAKNWRSVTVYAADSGLADALSTALFLLPLEEGQNLLESCDAEAMWLDSQGQRFYSPGFRDYIQK